MESSEKNSFKCKSRRRKITTVRVSHTHRERHRERERGFSKYVCKRWIFFILQADFVIFELDRT